MAKNSYKNPFSKGLTYVDLMKIPQQTLSDKEVKRVANRLNTTANQRARRLLEYGLKTGVVTPALSYLLESKGKSISDFSLTPQGKLSEKFTPFSTQGITTRSDIQSVAMQSKNFLNLETSSRARTLTSKGEINVAREISKGIQERLDIEDFNYEELEEDSKKDFWKLYRRIEELNGGVFQKGDSTQVQARIAENWNRWQNYKGGIYTKKGEFKKRIIDSLNKSIIQDYEENTKEKFINIDFKEFEKE